MDAAVILHDVHIYAALGAELLAVAHRIVKLQACSQPLARKQTCAQALLSGALFSAHIFPASAPRLTVTEPDNAQCPVLPAGYSGAGQ